MAPTVPSSPSSSPRAVLPKPAAGFPRSHYPKGAKGSVAHFFHMRNANTELFVNECIGGVTMFLVSVYILNLGRILSAGYCPSCVEFQNGTSPAGFTAQQYAVLPTGIALTSGISTVLMGLFGGVPLILAPGVSYGLGFQSLSMLLGPKAVNGANVCVGLIILGFAIASRRAKAINALPEDYRLGVASGIGGLLALVGCRNMGLVTMDQTNFVSSFQYQTVLSVLGIIIIAWVRSMSERFSPYAFIVSICIVTVASVIVREQSGIALFDPNEAGLASLSSITTMPIMNTLDLAPFPVAQYIVANSIDLCFDMMATTTAIILIAVMTKLGYQKETFVEVLGESTKCLKIYLTVAFCNILVAPFFGTALVTPFIESAAGVVVGARSGLAAVVCGCLFLISALFAAPISQIIPPEATGPSIVVACFAVIQSLRYIEYDRAVRAIPALLAFVLIPFTSSIGMGVSFSYVVLFAVWALSPNWVKLSPQMFIGLCMCMLLLLVQTNMLQSAAAIGFCVLGLGLCAAIVSFIMIYYAAEFETRFGNSRFDPSSSAPEHPSTIEDVAHSMRRMVTSLRTGHKSNGGGKNASGGSQGESVAISAAAAPAKVTSHGSGELPQGHDAV